MELEETLFQLGGNVSSHDPAMYLYYDEGGDLKGMILTHVDDLLHGSGDQEFEEQVLKPLKEKFLFGSEEESAFFYVGMQVKQSTNSITVSLDHYVENI